MAPDRRHFLTRASAVAGAASLGHASLVLAQAGNSAALPSPAALEAKAPPLPAMGTRLGLPQVDLFDDTLFRPEQADGQVLVIYWWASDCPFCAQQSPEMQKLWQAQRARGLRMLALSIDRKREDAVDYLKKKGYTFPAGLVTPAIQRVMPKPRGLPVTLVRGRDGKVVAAEKGQLFPEDVELLAQWL